MEKLFSSNWTLRAFNFHFCSTILHQIASYFSTTKIKLSWFTAFRDSLQHELRGSMDFFFFNSFEICNYLILQRATRKISLIKNIVSIKFVRDIYLKRIDRSPLQLILTNFLLAEFVKWEKQKYKVSRSLWFASLFRINVEWFLVINFFADESKTRKAQLQLLNGIIKLQNKKRYLSLLRMTN